MKKKNFNRELSLNIETIARLTSAQVKSTAGGDDIENSVCSRCSKKCCYSNPTLPGFPVRLTEGEEGGEELWSCR
ncbi:MAG TPA: class I lanthipeptide [Chitinophaga sp.]|uniref:class I lanthipeptide n=1 Tax=Chitinophaga sp. TaxID=1869181 RepID=UPI002B7C799C|nr:class I lanthipeptide [Chitinophaga sp.]HVI44832.1 class I lanthipeptide [Chitinophaga sp.]